MQKDGAREDQDFWRGICDIPSCMQSFACSLHIFSHKADQAEDTSMLEIKFINSAVHRYLSEAIKAHQCFLLPFFQLIKFLPSHCASPEPQTVQYFVRDGNCFRGRKSKALEI